MTASANENVEKQGKTEKQGDVKDKATSTKRSGAGVTVAIIALVIVLAAFPMFFNLGDPDAEEAFGGTDGAATEAIEKSNPDYEPWFEPIVGELPGEVESGIFALQAGLGAGVLGYVLGFYRGRGKGRDEALAERREAGTP